MPKQAPHKNLQWDYRFHGESGQPASVAADPSFAREITANLIISESSEQLPIATRIGGEDDDMPAGTKLKVGDLAPDFTLPALPDGKPTSLSDYRGRRVVLYFYPKDMTPGCTTEACEFRDSQPEFASANAVILGVSPDSIEDHRKFADKYELPFPLLTDQDHAVAEKYGAWVEKNMYGRKSWGVQRSTFLIDDAGRIDHIWPRVRVAGHVAAVAEKLAELA